METVKLNQNLMRFTVLADPSAGRNRAHYAFISSVWLGGRCTILHRSLVHSVETCSFFKALIDHVAQTRHVTCVGSDAIADIFVICNLKTFQKDAATQLEGSSLENYNVCLLGHRTLKPKQIYYLGVFDIVGAHIDEDQLHYFGGLLQMATIV